MDMAMVPSSYPEFITDLKQLVDEGTVPMSRIDDAVTRILRVKFAMGLMDKNRSQLADRSLQKTFGSPEHRAGGPRGRAPVAGAAEEREQDPAAHEDRRPASTWPARAPTTSATSAAAGPSTGRARAAT